ncbi:MAG: hypothetical protein QOD62_1621, partial [Actinomycetota bacterium]|nr:hypothetical protein [Actinomycetota bacterium]
MKKLIRSPIFYFLILIAVIWVVASFVTRGVGVKKLTYGDFKTKLAHGEISKLVVEHKSETITGTLSDGTKFRSSFLSTSRLDDLLAQHPEVPQDVNPQNQSVWVGILT